MPNKGLLWGAAYAAFSISSFGASLVFSAAQSYDFITLSLELTDNLRLTVLLNFIVFCFLAAGFASVVMLFGHIRIIEIEHIADQMPFYGLNLLFILFNDNNLLLNMMWTGLTLLSKVHHILTNDRVDFLQVQVVNRMSSSQHTRGQVLTAFVFNGYVVLSFLLLAADIVMARVLAYDIFRGTSSMGSLLFGIQFGVMGIDSFAFLGKLALNVYELVAYRCANPHEGLDVDDEDDLDEQIWEHRAIYMQSFDIVVSVSKTVFYAAFLYTLYFHSRLALPIPLIQGCIVSVHSVAKQMYNFASYLKKARHLDNQLRSPTPDELAAADHMCIICREDMHLPEEYQSERGRPLNSRKRPKKLQCNHILHLCCLKDWLERSDSCPLCRKPVFSTGLPAVPQDGAPDLPPDPAPVDRPHVPAETGNAADAVAQGQMPRTSSPAPTPTPTFSDTRVMAEANTTIDPGSLRNGSRNGVSCSFSEEVVSKGPVFVPRDWAAFPITPAEESNLFDVRFSATQTAQLRIRRRNEV